MIINLDNILLRFIKFLQHLNNLYYALCYNFSVIYKTIFLVVKAKQCSIAPHQQRGFRGYIEKQLFD